MKIMIIDTETTGAAEEDQVVEVAAVVLDDDPPAMTAVTSLVASPVMVHVEARATHHITDTEIQSGIPVEKLADFLPRADVMAAHSAAFDLRLLLQSGVPRDALPPRVICTRQCARHVFPDAPSHSNQVLRYWLELALPMPLVHPPHRALTDAIVTAALLERLRAHHSVDRLVEMTSEPVLLTTVRFGKHRGKKWDEVDTDYLRWVAATPDFEPDVLHTARHIIAERERKVRERLEEERLQQAAAEVPAP